MDKINEQMYNANIDLVDKNKLLEEDKKILQKRIDKALEVLNNFDIDNGTACRIVKQILEGKYIGDKE